MYIYTYLHISKSLLNRPHGVQVLRALLQLHARQSGGERHFLAWFGPASPPLPGDLLAHFRRGWSALPAGKHPDPIYSYMCIYMYCLFVYHIYIYIYIYICMYIYM